MLLPVYKRPAITLDHGHGCYVHDTTGKRYLDFTSGIGVNALGHCHPRLIKAIAEQSAKLIHSSNLFHNAHQQPLAERLAKLSGLDRVFFSNSGSEATEAALKVSRMSGKHKLVALENSFHGRTMGALSVTGQAKYRTPFYPLLPGVTFIPANDITALQAAVDDETAAILVETIQGEGGIHEMTEAFLREVRRLADFHNALWIADETQCGLGRTGAWFAYQRFAGLLPDVVTTAKPLAAGIPLAATIISEKAAAGLGKGQHGTTFGGGPLACRVALEVLDIVEELLPNIQTTGQYFRRRLGELPGVAQVRGAGLMLGAQLATEGDTLVTDALEQGLLVNCTRNSVLRLLPPFIAGRAEVDEAMEILLRTMCRNGTLSDTGCQLTTG